MTFQTTVNRAYTTGFPGDIVRDGPKRGKVARVTSPTIGTDPAASSNHMGRAFGYTGDGPPGTSIAAYALAAYEVEVGGTNFFGILGHPKAQALGGESGDPLAPSLDLPMGAAGEFFDMVTGIVVELFNETTAAKNVTFGDAVAYVLKTGDNAEGVPHGGLVSCAPGAAAPAGMALIPNARVMASYSIPASAAGAPKSVLAIIQLTQ